MTDITRKLKLTGDASGAIKATKQLNKEQERLERTIRSNNDAVERYDRSFNEISKRVSVFGDVDTGLATVGSTLSGVLGAGAGEAFTLGADVFASAEALPRLGEGIKELQLRAKDAGGVIGLLGGASMPQLAIAAGAVAAGVGLLAFALDDVNKQSREATKGIRDVISRTDEYYQLLVTGSTQDVEAAIEAKRQELEIAKARQQEVQAFGDAANTTLGSLARETGRVFRAFGADNAYTDIVSGAEAASESAEEINRLQKELTDLESISGKGATAANDLKEREAELVKTREDAFKKLSDVTAQLNEQQAQLTENYEKQTEAIAAQRQLQDERSAEDRAIAEKRAQEDLDRSLEKQAQDHQDRLVSIADKGQQAVENAQAEAAQRVADSQERIATETAQFNEQQAKRIADYNKERLRSTEDFERNRRRLEEDFAEDRFEAILSNDAAAFLRAQREQKKQTQRNQEDFNVETERAGEDFAETQAEEQEAFAQRIQSIQNELSEYLAATDAKIQAIQEQTQAELAQEQIAFDEKLAIDAEERAIKAQREQEDRELARAREIEDRAIQDEARKASHEEALQRIEDRKQKELEVYFSAVTGINNVDQAFQTLIGNSLTRLTTVNSPGINPFASPSNMVQFQQSLQAQAGVANAAGNIININNTVGEITTPSQLNGVFNNVVDALEQVFGSQAGKF